MQSWYNIEGFPVNVSTHGYITIYGKGVPVMKFSDAPVVVCDAPINVLGSGIKYLPDSDDISINLGDPKLDKAIKRFVKKHLVHLNEKNEEVVKNWKKIIKEKPPLILKNGDEVRIGDYADYDGRIVKLMWYERRGFLSITCESLDSGQYSTNGIKLIESGRRVTIKEANQFLMASKL